MPGDEAIISGGLRANVGGGQSIQLNVADDGTVGDDFSAAAVEVNISGGTVGDGFNAEAFGVVNISGGTIGDTFEAFTDSIVNIFGSAFFIDGVELDTLTPGETFTIANRDVTLSGLLADGQTFSFDLNSCLLYTSPSPRDQRGSRMPSSA